MSYKPLARDELLAQRSTRRPHTPEEPLTSSLCAFFTAPCAWRAAAGLFSAAVTATDRQPERLCAFSSFSCSDAAAMASPESSEDDELPMAQLRIVRPAGRGAVLDGEGLLFRFGMHLYCRHKLQRRFLVHPVLQYGLEVAMPMHRD